MYFHTSVTLGLFAVAQLVAGHGAIIKAVGDQGGAGSAIGVDPNTPRDGTKRNPFQQDSTRFKGQNKATCGQTLGGGENDIETGTKAVLQMNNNQLPQVSAGGEISMTLHQVNGDGAGPYSCMIDATGTGQNWQTIQVTTQVDGKNGNNRQNAMQDLPLKAAIPAGQTCSGTVAGQQNVCMVRCQNTARAGPFGGCVPVQMANAGAGNTTAAAAPAAAPAASGAASKAVDADTAAADAEDMDKRSESLDDDPEFLAELRADGEEI